MGSLEVGYLESSLLTWSSSPTRTTFTPCSLAALKAPSTMFWGAKSPPIASTAIFIAFFSFPLISLLPLLQLLFPYTSHNADRHDEANVAHDIGGRAKRPGISIDHGLVVYLFSKMIVFFLDPPSLNILSLPPPFPSKGGGGGGVTIEASIFLDHKTLSQFPFLYIRRRGN